MKLLIVESPHKVKTVAKALGKDYKVMASVGHIIDLPKSKLGVDVEHDFAPQYQNIKSKAQLIKELCAEAKKADAVYLATDPDREGEAISWHLAHLLGIDVSSPCRVAFNEITENAIRNGVASPRSVDLDLVDAQQARRVLDRLVGYEISPILWRKVKAGLSAGRVQSPAVRLVVDREREIQAFVPREYWTLNARLTADEPFEAQFWGTDGKKRELASMEEAQQIMDACRDFTVASYKEGRKKRSAPTPFTTSMLQQEASRKLGFTTRKTMRVAQDLYEGVELKDGSVGLVTYIRTDSLRLSSQAVEMAREYIKNNFGGDYLPPKPRVFKSKSDSQDAHEAIRPTSLSRSPKQVRSYLTDDQYKLYKLIYERFLACQMSDAVYATRSAELVSTGHNFRASAQQRIFDGYMAVYIEGANKVTEDKSTLPVLHEGQPAVLDGFEPAQHFTEPPARYNEASLVKELEDKGIGRPSTFASIISTILDREYIERDKKNLKPTQLGFCVVDFMLNAFPDIVDVHFTAGMESELDKVEEGQMQWTDVVRSFYGPFHQSVLAAADAPHVRVPVIETDIPCDKCGRMMVVRSSRYGKFLACPCYPECKNTRPMPEDEVKVPCPKCGAKLVKRAGKNGGRKFYGCSRYPECDFASSGLPTGEICPECGSYIIEGYRGRKMCMNLDCPTRAADKLRYEKKLAKAAQAEKKSAAKEKGEKTTAAKKTSGEKAAKTAAKKAPAKKAAKKTAGEKTIKPAAKKAVSAKKPAAKKRESTAEKDTVKA